MREIDKEMREREGERERRKGGGVIERERGRERTLILVCEEGRQVERDWKIIIYREREKRWVKDHQIETKLHMKESA